MTWERVEDCAGRLEWAPKLAYWGQRGVLCHSGEVAGEKGDPAALGWPWLLGLLPSTSAWGELHGEPAKGRESTFTCRSPGSGQSATCCWSHWTSSGVQAALLHKVVPQAQSYPSQTLRPKSYRQLSLYQECDPLCLLLDKMCLKCMPGVPLYI